MKREIELDFIRGIAILLVLDFHSPVSIVLAPFKWIGFQHFGWAGVDLFFVLSGFLVGGLLIREWKSRSSVDTRRFLVRRAFKIWPQYYFFLLIMLVTGHRGFHALWGNFLNIQNYVGGVAHTWTLAVEEHAYLLLAVALSFAAWRSIGMRSLLMLTGATALFVVIWRTMLAAHGVDIFARTDTRIDGILYGVMLAILYQHFQSHFRRLQSLTWVWATVIVLALTYFRVNPTSWWGADLSYVCADAMGIALLLLLYKHQEGKSRPMLYRFVAWMGTYSYGIYLWHVSVISPLESIAHHLKSSAGHVFLAVVPAAGVAIGMLTTKAIEFPALAYRDRLFPRKVEVEVGTGRGPELELHAELLVEGVDDGEVVRATVSRSML